MGLFDAIFGEVKCLNCGEPILLEFQFKFGECMQLTYYLGDEIEAKEKDYYIIRNDYQNCESCETKVYANAIVRHLKVIAFLHDSELMKIPLDHLQDVPLNFYRNQAYAHDCEIGSGRSNEFTVFSEQPFNIRQKITALGIEWEIKEVYKKTFDETKKLSPWIKLAGSFNRKSDVWYLYKVYSENFGERYLEVSDSRKSFGIEQKGNMELFLVDEYKFKDEYLFEKIV